MAEKKIMDFTVERTELIGSAYALLTLRPASGEPVPATLPGQFVQVAIDNKGTFLRRPISICAANDSELQLLVRVAGEGTRWLCNRQPGDTLNLILPLGNDFPFAPAPSAKPVLLVGGGVGIAPMNALAEALSRVGHKVNILIGARNEETVLLADSLARYGKVYVTTEDGSVGEKGLVTHSSAWADDYDTVYCCGPAPMMKAVARICRDRNLSCQVSLENMMACGLGACLCCVEKTVKGNVCVCTEGPVFDIKQLTWD